jgi:hypothetical protein
MKYNKLDASNLCDIIVEEIGIPLPTYDYNYKKYIASFPQNIKIGECVTGIEKADMFDTFKLACIAIIEWHNALTPKFERVIIFRGLEWKQSAEVLDCIMCKYNVGCNSWGCVSPSCMITQECFGGKSIGSWCPFGEIPDDKKFLFKE